MLKLAMFKIQSMKLAFKVSASSMKNDNPPQFTSNSQINMVGKEWNKLFQIQRFPLIYIFKGGCNDTVFL